MPGKRYFRQGGGGISPVIISEIVKGEQNSLSTYKERRDRARWPFIGLVKAMLKRGDEVPQILVDDMNKYKAELEAEQRGGRTETRG